MITVSLSCRLCSHWSGIVSVLLLIHMVMIFLRQISGRHSVITAVTCGDPLLKAVPFIVPLAEGAVSFIPQSC